MGGLRGNGTVAVFHDSVGRFFVCVKDDRATSSPGVFHGESPFDYVLPVTLFQLFLVILISRALCFLLRPIKTPKFICNVMGGIILGPSVLGNSEEHWKLLFPVRQADPLILASILGSVYFVFIVVLKMDVRMTIRSARSTWLLGIVPFLTSAVVIAVLLNLFYLPQSTTKLNPEVVGFVSTIMSFSFFPVVADALTELNLIATELGQIALSSAMCNDIIEWFHIMCIRISIHNNITYTIFAIVSALVFLLFSVFVIRPAVKLIVRTTPIGKPVKEIYVVLILLGVMVMAGVSDAIGLSFVLGPLVLGLVIPGGPPLGTTLVDKCEVIMSEFLLPFFFIYIGLSTDLTALKSLKEVVIFQSIMIAGLLAKMLACVLVGRFHRIKAKQGLVLGLMLNIKGIIELIASTRMKKMGVLDDKTFSQIVVFVVVITAVMTPLVKVLNKHRARLQRAPSILEGRMNNIQTIPRNSDFILIACVHNEGNVRGIIALLEACNPCLESPIFAYLIHLVELLGKSAPILLPISYKQNKKFLTVNYPNTNHIVQAFENYANSSGGPVTVIPYINVAPYKNMHEAICNLAQDKYVPLVVIPFHENDHIDLDGHVASSISKMNSRLQKRLPCTVGLLVDRYSRLGASDSKYSFHIGIFFIGGEDDREALALGIRMSDKPNAVVSLFRFVLRSKKRQGFKEEEEEERSEEEMLDEGLVEEFKSRKFGNGNVRWSEIVVEDVVELLEVIRGLEGNYDLVMVGRRHEIHESLDEEEMANFLENTKVLGIVGDTLSSTEFCIGMVPVLVTQCGGRRKGNHLDRVGSLSGFTSQHSEC